MGIGVRIGGRRPFALLPGLKTKDEKRERQPNLWGWGCCEMVFKQGVYASLIGRAQTLTSARAVSSVVAPSGAGNFGRAGIIRAGIVAWTRKRVLVPARVGVKDHWRNNSIALLSLGAIAPLCEGPPDPYIERSERKTLSLFPSLVGALYLRGSSAKFGTSVWISISSWSPPTS
ncbi:hypothetical protein B0H17DRAFT_1132742 [Mycena rosella]|uniref:Uncharacterized protein n=1 Tax=Mycena rosella TaxID=1033263 RepID=A0AAD7DLL0_MYCRO|nr:hypothetical protein B0H17DRAFT_1132742 [Mycena rosella]